MSYDFTNFIQEEGRYKVGIYTISSDVFTIANSTEAFSDILDTKTYTTEVAEELSEIIATNTAEEALSVIDDTYTTNGLLAAMQTDDGVVDLMESLENQYVADKGITVATNVSEDAKEYISESNVEIVGAGLNASGSEITLDVSIAEEKELPASKYDKKVVLDIKLLDGEAELHDLKIPVKITMDIPNGILAENLILLHYTKNGTEQVEYINNGDGTVSFMVGSFSMFEFADSTTLNEDDDDENTDSGNTDGSNTDNDNTDSGNSDNSNTDNSNTNNNDSNNENVDNSNSTSGNNTTNPIATTTSPKTGDNSAYPLCFVVLAMLCLLSMRKIYKNA